MAKKKEEVQGQTQAQVPATNSNINTNNNTINLNVKVDQPKAPRKKKTVKEPPKPNWILKAIVIGLIGLILPFLWNYIKNALEGGHGELPVIEYKPGEGVKGK